MNGPVLFHFFAMLSTLHDRPNCRSFYVFLYNSLFWEGGSFVRSHVMSKIMSDVGRGEVNTSDFMNCSTSLLSDNQSIYNYLMFSGDSDGVNITMNGSIKSYKAYCADNFFWPSISCRADPTKCVLFVTGGDGWDTLPMLQRSSAYNIPIAFGVAANYAKYLTAPKEYTSLFLTCARLNLFALCLSGMSVVAKNALKRS